jgi:hypothetical protein
MSQATKRTERGSIERKAPGADVSLDKRKSSSKLEVGVTNLQASHG